MPDIRRDSLHHIFEVMTTIRQCEERVRTLLMSGQLMVMCHSPRGHEGICAGIAEALRPDDYVVTTYRGMGDQIAKGVALKEIWAEYLGRSTGACGGKGGPMHITAPDCGLMVTTGVVGSGIPIANGYGLASQLSGSDRVTVCNFGDGATNIGAFHEALNLAQVWSLPVVFVCHNNGWAEHTAVRDHQRNEAIGTRAEAYGMPGVTIDGRDPVAVWDAALTAVERARRGDGPTLIEALCDRLAGHYIGDTQDYVPPELLVTANAADPVPAFRARLLSMGAASEEDLLAIEKRVTALLDEAVDFASNSPFPEPAEIRRDVYAEEVLP